MTTITVHDTPALFEALYLSTAKPAERFALLSPMLEKNGLMRVAQGALVSDAVAVMTAGGVDGGCSIGQQGFGLFNPTRRASASALVLDAFRRHDLIARARDVLARCAAVMPVPNVDEVQVFLFPTDPANRAQMLDAYGMAGIALTQGVIVAQVYPTPEGLARFDALLARWWSHQWYTAMPAWEVYDGKRHWSTQGLEELGAWVSMESQAIWLAEHIAPDLTLPAWMAPFHPTPDWEATLTAMAAHYGLTSYDDMMVNTYGQTARVGPERLPLPAPIDAEMAELIASTLRDVVRERRAPVIAAHLYGDAIVARQGFPGVGMPPFGACACIAAYNR